MATSKTIWTTSAVSNSSPSQLASSNLATSSVSNLANSTISVSPNSYNYSNFINFDGNGNYGFVTNGLEEFGKYIALIKTEDEIAKLLEDIKTALINSTLSAEEKEALFSKILLSLVELRHFSEEFLMNIFEDMDKQLRKKAIFVNHKADLLSNSYSSLALRILMDEDSVN